MISPVAPSELLGEQVLTVGLALSSLAGDSVADVQSERPWCSKTLALVNTFMFFPIILHLLNAPWCLAGVEGPQPLAVRPAARGSWLCSAKPQVWGLASPRGCPVWLWGRICRLEQDWRLCFQLARVPLFSSSNRGSVGPYRHRQASRAAAFWPCSPTAGAPSRGSGPSTRPLRRGERAAPARPVGARQGRRNC